MHTQTREALFVQSGRWESNTFYSDVMYTKILLFPGVPACAASIRARAEEFDDATAIPGYVKYRYTVYSCIGLTIPVVRYSVLK